MTVLRGRVDRLLAQVASLIPAGTDSKDYLRSCVDAQIEASSRQTSMGIVPSSIASATQVFASARTTVELLDDPAAIAERPEGIVDLGTIEWLLRPALPVHHSLIDVPPGPPWNKLDRHIVAESSKAVCRVDLLIEGYQPHQLGTGFLIGNSGDSRFVLMTNTHVVNAALQVGWRNRDGIELGCDFERCSTVSEGTIFNVAREYPPRVHPQYDLSLLILEMDGSDGSPRTEILSVTSQIPDPAEGLEVGVIGHPSFDSTRDPFPKYFGFGDEFGIKRFSPGYIRAIEKRLWQDRGVDLFLHDATTLSGSSGSCIVDLRTGKVVGLHFGGWPIPERVVKMNSGDDVVAQLFEANGAVPLWLLAGDPILDEVRFA